jgi:D-lactate dehydrogenase
LTGFGGHLLGYDFYQSREFTDLGGKHVDLDTLFAESDIISLHCPLTPQTFHLIDAESVAKMKKGVMIINTSRGALVDASAAFATVGAPDQLLPSPADAASHKRDTTE